jgi:hypothetical protein
MVHDGLTVVYVFVTNGTGISLTARICLYPYCESEDIVIVAARSLRPRALNVGCKLVETLNTGKHRRP